MSIITREQAKDLRNAFQCWQQDYDPVEDKEQYYMFGLGMVAMDALLASLEPVSVIKIDHESSLIKHVKRVVSETNAPPAPVLPDLKELEAILDWILMLPCPTPKATHFAKRLAVVIDACRNAMLQSFGNSEQLNSPVIPDGYALVPVEPTEDMIVNGFESEPDESFSDADVWEAYESMSGCQQAAHRAKLCWAAMIAAAPKPEVK